MLPLLFAYLGNIRWSGLFVPVVVALLMAAFLTLAYAAQPVAYVVEQDALVIRRRWLRTLSLPYSNMISVAPSSPLAVVPWNRLRFAFNPGVFGYQGSFHLKPYGKVFFIATNQERFVAIARTSLPPIIISPAHPRACADALIEKLNTYTNTAH